MSSSVRVRKQWRPVVGMFVNVDNEWRPVLNAFGRKVDSWDTTYGPYVPPIEVNEGKPYWIVAYPLNEENDMASLAANPNGGVFVGSPLTTGYFVDFVAAFDDAGNGPLWQKEYSSPDFDSYFGPMVAAEDALYVARLRSDEYLGVSKYSSDGSVFSFELTEPITNADYPVNLFLDGDNNVYLCSSFPPGDNPSIIWKLDSNLSRVWCNGFDFSEEQFSARAACSDFHNSIYMSGSAPAESTFIPGLVKIDSSDASIIWGSTIPNFSDDEYEYLFTAGSIATHETDLVYVAGTYSPYDGYGFSPYPAVLKYDSSGNLLDRWILSDQDFSWTEVRKIVVDGDGNVYLSFQCVNQSNAFVLKFDSNGNVIWKRNLNSQSIEMNLGVSPSGADVLYFTSRFYTGYIGYTFMVLKLPTDGSLIGTYSIPVYEWGSEDVSWLSTGHWSVAKDVPSSSSFALTSAPIELGTSSDVLTVVDADYSAVKVDIEV